MTSRLKKSSNSAINEEITLEFSLDDFERIRSSAMFSEKQVKTNKTQNGITPLGYGWVNDLEENHYNKNDELLSENTEDVWNSLQEYSAYLISTVNFHHPMQKIPCYYSLVQL